jgi:hypothetical protein
MKTTTKASPEAVDAMFHLADSKGIQVCSTYRREYERWKYFIYDTDSNKVYGSNVIESGGGEIGVGEMFESLANAKPTNRMRLTETYEAVVNYNSQTVTVGCQTIPFEKVTELYRLMTK